MGAGAVEHSRAYSVVKNEDAVELCCLDLPTGEGLKAIGEASQARLFMMCDGHIGNTCSRLISKRFPEVLRHKLPRTEVPSEDDAAFGKYTAAVVRAMAESFVEIDNILLKEDIGRSGSTTTALLVIGNLITVANVGDSDCVLDTGIAWMSLTKSHRIVANPSEEQRLLRAGRTVAKLGFHLQGPALGDERGVGPLRLWPGGLAMARSVGDFDSGSECAPVPHIKQVLLTSKETVRIILASDGLWDAVSTPKAVRAVRNMPVFSAASELVRLAARNPHVIDDTTVLVIDVVPPGAPSFPAPRRAARAEVFSGASGAPRRRTCRRMRRRGMPASGSKSPSSSSATATASPSTRTYPPRSTAPRPPRRTAAAPQSPAGRPAPTRCWPRARPSRTRSGQRSAPPTASPPRGNSRPSTSSLRSTSPAPTARCSPGASPSDSPT